MVVVLPPPTRLFSPDQQYLTNSETGDGSRGGWPNSETGDGSREAGPTVKRVMGAGEHYAPHACHPMGAGEHYAPHAPHTHGSRRALCASCLPNTLGRALCASCLPNTLRYTQVVYIPGYTP